MYCMKKFKTQSNLKTHISKSKRCISARDSEKDHKNKHSCLCGYDTILKNDYNRHIKNCKEKLIKEKEAELKEKDRLIKEYEIRLNEKEEQIDMLRDLLDKALSKPSVTNNTNTSNNNMNVKGNQMIQNILSNQYDEYTSNERIEQIARQSIEKYFWEGQAGISRFCVDHIITTEEGKKIICCTDVSRKKFKYFKDDRLIEDVEARAFTEKISLPIKKVCREVYDTTIRKIEEEREEKTDAFELNLLDHKTNRAQEKLLEIINIDDNNNNTQYKNELSVLLKV